MIKMTQEQLGAFLRNRRRKLGLTGRELARAIGIKSAGYIYMLEAGAEIPPARAPALARALGLNEGAFTRLVLSRTYPELANHIPIRLP